MKGENYQSVVRNIKKEGEDARSRKKSKKSDPVKETSEVDQIGNQFKMDNQTGDKYKMDFQIGDQSQFDMIGNQLKELGNKSRTTDEESCLSPEAN
jgi:hypothetical protein